MSGRTLLLKTFDGDQFHGEDGLFALLLFPSKSELGYDVTM